MIKEWVLRECVEKVIDYRGKTPAKLGGTWSDTGYRVISALNVHDGYIDNEDQIRYVSQSVYEKWMQEEIKRNDCFLASEGASLGESAIWDSDEKVVLGQRLYAIRVNPKVLDPWYLAMYMQTRKFRDQVDQVSTGSTVFGISQSVLLSLKLLLPEIAEQRLIGRIYHCIKDKIENNSAICSNLESMAKLLYDYWFVQFDFPDENGKPYKSSGGKMVWNEELKREIPEGWAVKRIGDVISTERGISYNTANIQTGEGVPMLNLATFKPGGGDYKTDGLKHYLGDYPKNKVLKPYELIMCNTQQTAIKFETDIIGRAMLVPDIFDGDVVSSHHVNVIRTESDDLKYYLLYLFNSDYYHKYISGFTNGTNILGLSFSGVEDYRTEIASSKVLKEFGEIILSVEKKKSEIFRENQQLASLRDFLLPMLMNGQVTIKEN